MTNRNVDENEDSKDTLKILIATDNHLGYMEKDGCRTNDSLNTFEEMLKIARDNDVDFILLGGDLFHDNKPSRKSLHGSIKLFRQYCYGDKPCSVAFLSDPSVNFGHTPFPVVNYEDPNVNVSIPVFSIHGNHDDPAGQDNLCSLDLLHSAGLVNYFGKVVNLEQIELSPLLLTKGSTKLALYGLGAIRDERLHRIFCQKNFKMLRPKENKDEWFSLFVIHQNRAKHGPKNYIPEQFLDDFLDLVLWGHEHECKIDPSWNGVQKFYITQPGSSIATSLSDGETKEKHVGLLFINGKNFKLKKVKLNTVRQFYMEDIVLRETKIKPQDQHVAKKIEAYCSEVMERLLEQAEAERKGNKEIPSKPLIRLRIDYTSDDPDCSYELFSTHRFGQKYVERVANPREIIFFQRKKALSKTKDNQDVKIDIEVKAESLDSARVEDMVKEYFIKAEKHMQLNLLTEQGISEAVKEFVLKEERDAIEELVKHQLKKTQNYLIKRNTKEETVDDEIFRFKEERKKDTSVLDQELKEAIDLARSKRSNNGSLDDDDDDDDNDDDNTIKLSKTKSARKPKSNSFGDDDDEDDDGDGMSIGGARKKADTKSGRGRGRGSRGARGARGGTRKTSSEIDVKSLSRSNKNATRKTNKKYDDVDDEDENTCILDDDDNNDDEISILTKPSTTKKPSKSSTKINDMLNSKNNSQFLSMTPQGKGAKRGVNFFGDDSEDDEAENLFDKLMPNAKKRK